ncbi:prolyl endopeptidase [Rickettsia sibirica]
MPSDAIPKGSFKAYVFWLLRSDWQFKDSNIEQVHLLPYATLIF